LALEAEAISAVNPEVQQGDDNLARGGKRRRTERMWPVRWSPMTRRLTRLPRGSRLSQKVNWKGEMVRTSAASSA
jgi:hypothetical protein